MTSYLLNSKKKSYRWAPRLREEWMEGWTANEQNEFGAGDDGCVLYLYCDGNLKSAYEYRSSCNCSL